MTAPHSTLAERIVDGIRRVTGEGPVGLHEPHFVGNEWTYVKECLDSTFVSSVGAFVTRFEAEIAAVVGARHAIAVVNGTAALQVALRLAGVQRDEEVLIPTLTFVATASAAVHAGATPHFIESEERTLGVDPRALREYLAATTEMRGGLCINRATGRVIRAMVPMHTFGHPVDIDGILAVGRDFNIAVVEDAAESIGSTYGGRHTGTFGVVGTLSFNGNKTITTGGGGAIVTNDDAIGRRAKHLIATAKVPHRWAFVHDDVGYNYRMPNLNAALGCAQLEQLPRFIEAKRRLHDRYAAEFANVPDMRLMNEPAGCRSNYWLDALILDERVAEQRDAILGATNDAALMTRPVWTLMHRLAPYAAFPRMEVPIAESLERRIINIPSSPKLALEVPA